MKLIKANEWIKKRKQRGWVTLNFFTGENYISAVFIENFCNISVIVKNYNNIYIFQMCTKILLK